MEVSVRITYRSFSICLQVSLSGYLQAILHLLTDLSGYLQAILHVLTGDQGAGGG